MTLKFDGSNFRVIRMDELVFNYTSNQAKVNLIDGNGRLEGNVISMFLRCNIQNSNIALKQLTELNASLRGSMDSIGAVDLRGSGTMQAPTTPCEVSLTGKLIPRP